MLRFISTLIVSLLMFGTNAIAADWVAKNLKGGVFVFTDNAWVQIERGHVVSDASAIQTAKGARVTFVRGKESISIRADTRIRISDKDGAKRTVVSQDFGEITVDVEKKNVEHFEVRSPILAAVVKGTKFTVSSRGKVASIDVDRGRVEARDNKAGMKVDVKPGQDVSVNVAKNPVLVVQGRGSKEPIRSTSSGAALTVKQIIRKVEQARPASPVNLALVKQIAEQQGVVLTKADQEYAAAKELKAAKASGDAELIATAEQSTNSASQQSSNGNNGASSVAEVKAAEKTLKAAIKSGDASAIAAAENAVEEVQSSETSSSGNNAGGNSASNANENSNAGGNSEEASSNNNAGGNSSENASENSNAGGNSEEASSSNNAGGNSAENANENSNAGGNSEEASSSNNAGGNGNGNGNGNGKNK